MMDNGLDVPLQVRDLAAMSLDNIEKAFAQFFDAATRSIAPNSAEIIVLLERVISVKIDYVESWCSRKTLRKRPHCNLHIAERKSKLPPILFE
jgi:hypothetical protein